MPVTSLLTLIEDMEGTPTLVSPGSGNAGGTNTDIFIEGSQSIGRRVDNASQKGLGCQVSAIDLSGTGVHVVGWQWVTQWEAVSFNFIRLGDGSNNDDHFIPDAVKPPLGGFVPIWVDVSRTPEAGGSANSTAITDFVFISNVANVGGAAQNYIVDAFHYGTSGYLFTGATGTFTDFTTYEDLNREGVIIPVASVLFVQARLEIGTAAVATVFSSLSVSLVFPNSSLVSSTFMGITVNIQNASTDVRFSFCSFASGSPVNSLANPDLTVVGTSGVFDASNSIFNGLREVNLNSACTMQNCTFINMRNGIVGGGADLRGSSFSKFRAIGGTTSFLIWDVATDPDGLLDNTSFQDDGVTAHAIEFGLNSPTSLTLRGIDFNLYDPLNGQNDSTFNIKRTSGTVTINLVQCTGIFSYTTAGATVEIINNPVDIQITCVDATGSPVSGARVLLETAGAGPYPYQGPVTLLTQSSGTATATHSSHNLATNDYVVISGANEAGYNGVYQITVTGANSYTYSVDAGTASPATGTIIATYAPISAVTGGTGIVNTSKAFSSDQDVIGVARKGTSAPRYKTAPISGAISSVSGLSQTAVMISDE